jgi:hypothetical protein
MSVTSPEAPLSLVPALPALRLLPVPPCEPPYDDELPAGAAVAAGAPIGPLRHLAPAPLRLVPPLPVAPVPPDDEDRPRRTSTGDLPAVRPVAQALVQGLLEVLAGVRPVSQLQRTTTPELFAELEQLVHGRPRTAGVRPATGAIRSLHVQERPEGVAEVCATVRRGSRMAAVALRLEGLAGRWCCTEVAGL